MADEKPPPSPLTTAQAKAAQIALEGAARRAAAAVEGAAHRALDEVERLVFGEVGGAEAQVKADSEGGSALERARAQYGLPPTPAPVPTENPVERARAQLAALKAERSAGGDALPVERKKTL